ncbi:MAG: phenylalanine--tRNA ligase subunit beta [Deltaproteobacteria bacterium]|nr:phenylalanine--tRNA ligase subunit beta [Deltaproteobacteria bacterium]
MKVSLNWLKEFVNFNTDVEKIANLLNTRTMEVEKFFPYFSQKKSFQNIVVGEIKSITEHPSSDKFGIAEVYGGETVGTKKIVFTKEGLDIKVGEKPLIATKGTVFEHGLKIRDKAIFGVISEAAFCSEKDLGMQLNTSSIIKFPFEKIGRTAYDIFELNDAVLEFDLEPNRPDLFGVLGFAYELSAILDKDMILPELYGGIEFEPTGKFSSKESELAVNVENKDLVPSYIAVKISGVKIKESSMDIKNKLLKGGIRPINNIVDLTNIVMLETAQPLHAFDAGKLEGGKINARHAKEGESVISIDGRERKLSGSDIVIADKNKIIAIAGVMGSSNSEIDENTADIIVEAANFNMSSVRKTSRNLSLRTDASTRFEKGLHPSLSVFGIRRFLHLLDKYAAGFNVSCHAYDINEFGRPKIYEIKLNDLSDFLGDSAVKNKASRFLSRLGYEIIDSKSENAGGGGSISVIPPYFRSDIAEDVNIYEDVFRIYGYDNIKSSVPSGILRPPQKNPNFETSMFFRNLLRCNGFIEIISPSLTGEKEISISIAGGDKTGVLELKNPVSKDYSFFRISIIPDLLKAVSQNYKKYKNIKIFEIGKIYLGEGSGGYPVAEKNILCGIVCTGIKHSSRETEFYNGKGVVELLLKESGIKKFAFNKADANAFYNENTALEILIAKNRVGIFGEIKKEILDEFKIEYKVFAFEFYIDFVKDFISGKKSFIQPNKYPGIEQDISIVADSGIEYAAVEKFIKGFSALIKNVRLVEVYSGKQINEGKISFLIRYDAIAEDRTMTMEEVNLLRGGLLKELNVRFGITLRS